MKRLVVIGEEEEEPIQISEKSVVTDETVALCLLGKLWTERPYSMYALIETMKKIWSPSKGMTCHELGSNLISFQFNTKRDMERIISMEPWYFNKHILVLKPLTGNIQPSLMKFDTTPCWIRLYDVPMAGRELNIIRKIGERVGEVMEIDDSTINGVARSVRLKVLIDLKNPLKRGTKIRFGSEEPCWIPITYERLSNFCYWCGRMGHTHKDCESYQERAESDPEITEKYMPFGEWMKASPMKIAQVVSHRSAETNDVIRKSLFQKKKKDTENDSRRSNRATPECNADTQVSELLKSLEKVEVGGLQDSATTTQPSHLHVQKPSIPHPSQPRNTITVTNPPIKPKLPFHDTLVVKPNFLHSTHTSEKKPDKTETHNQSVPSHNRSVEPAKPVPPTDLHQRIHPIKNNPVRPTGQKTVTLQEQYPIHPKTNETTHIQTIPISSQPYTPTSVLREMFCPITGIPRMNQFSKVKIETPSPIAQDEVSRQKIKNNKPKWKRKDAGKERVSTEKIDIGLKRNGDDMEVDVVSLPHGKRTRSTDKNSDISTAEAAGQPRRTL